MGVSLVRRVGPGVPLLRPLALVDPDFAKQQLDLMLQPGLPASERPDPGLRVEFQRRQSTGARLGDAVHCTASEQRARAKDDRGVPQARLSEAAVELHLVGEPQGPVRQERLRGGFLGLDNIGVFDRSAPLPTGGHLEQADGTAWMAMFSQNMLELAVDLAVTIRSTTTWPRSSSSTSCGSRAR